jgi:hypothetical protein
VIVATLIANPVSFSASWLNLPIAGTTWSSQFIQSLLREASALRWEDVDLDNRIITVCPAVEETNGYRGTKEPKTERGIRTFKIDEALAAMLVAHREKQQRLVALEAEGLALVRAHPPIQAFNHLRKELDDMFGRDDAGQGERAGRHGVPGRCGSEWWTASCLRPLLSYSA